MHKTLYNISKGEGGTFIEVFHDDNDEF